MAETVTIDRPSVAKPAPRPRSGKRAPVTVRYHPVETFDLFSQKLCKASAQALFPDAVALGLINTGLNRSARALSKAGESLDRIASAVFRAKGDRSKRNQIYSDTLDALEREDEKISNLRESLVSVERLLLFLMSEGRPENAPKFVREATKAAVRDLQTMEQRASRRKKCSFCWTRRSAASTSSRTTSSSSSR